MNDVVQVTRMNECVMLATLVIGVRSWTMQDEDMHHKLVRVMYER